MLRISSFAAPGQPGKNTWEYISKGDKRMRELQWVPNFRQLLSNREMTHPFKLGMYDYLSIEHVFQEHKWCAVFPEQEGYFSIKGKYGMHDLGTIVKMTGHTRLVMTAEQIKYWKTTRVQKQHDAFKAQCAAWPLKLSVLQSTGRATLMGMLSDQDYNRDFHMYWLEAIRDNIPLKDYPSKLKVPRGAPETYASAVVCRKGGE